MGKCVLNVVGIGHVTFTVCIQLHLFLSQTLHSCRCGRQLDMFGHHRAGCAEAVVSARRGGSFSCVHERRRETCELRGIQRPGGAKTRGRTDGLTVFGGAQLTLVSPVQRDGTAKRSCRSALEVALKMSGFTPH